MRVPHQFKSKPKHQNHKQPSAKSRFNRDKPRARDNLAARGGRNNRNVNRIKQEDLAGGTIDDPRTGRTTTGVINKDGSFTQTVTDRNGNATTTVIPKPVGGPTGISVPDGKGGFKPYNPPPTEPPGGTFTDPETGRTTTGLVNTGG